MALIFRKIDVLYLTFVVKMLQDKNIDAVIISDDLLLEKTYKIININQLKIMCSWTNNNSSGLHLK